MTLDYSSQIRRKEEVLEASLASMPHPPLEITVTSHERDFRNKAKFVVTGDLANPVIGLWGDDDLDAGKELLECPLHQTEINSALPVIKEFISVAKLDPYQIGNKKGELKGLIIFHSQETKETYLRFILRSKESISRLIKHRSFLVERLPHLKCISANIQPVPHALLEGEEEIFITDERHIRHKAGAVTFTLGPRAFVQTNQEVAARLYQTAAEWVKETGGIRFMELFCGQGAFSFFAAPYIKTGLGIEINEDAVAVANHTASSFGLSQLEFLSADAEHVPDQIQAFKPDVLLVNPPRRGIGNTAEHVLKLRPKILIYSSCNHVTLAGDLSKLVSSYSIQRIQIFDMFPHTTHFETLVLLKLNY